LLREKRESESFSNLALRLTRKHGTLKECLGLWKLSRKERKIFKEIKKSWEKGDNEMKRRLGS
jgi:predicted CopG family antitoxin